MKEAKELTTSGFFSKQVNEKHVARRNMRSTEHQQESSVFTKKALKDA
jgi:hypothetical protein